MSETQLLGEIKEAVAVRSLPCSTGNKRMVRHEFILDDATGSLVVTGQTMCCGAVAAVGVSGIGSGPYDLAPLCEGHRAEAGEPGTAEWAAFEERYSVNLRTEADQIALGHGIRGLALMWAARCPYCRNHPGKDIRDGMVTYCPDCEGSTRVCEGSKAHAEGVAAGLIASLDAYERESLLGWARRRMAAYAAAAVWDGITWTNDPAGREDMVEWLHQDLPEISADLVRSLCDAAGWPC